MLTQIKSTLKGLMRPPAIRTEAELVAFLAAEAAYLGQKAASDYCRAKAGGFEFVLFKEAAFQEALTLCRWEGFAASAEALVLLLQRGLDFAEFPPGVERRARLLEGLFKSVLSVYPIPAHRNDGWEGAIGAFTATAERAAAGEAPSLAALSEQLASHIYTHLPIHPKLRGDDDRHFVFGAVRLQLAAAFESMQRRIDWRVLGPELSRRG